MKSTYIIALVFIVAALVGRGAFGNPYPEGANVFEFGSYAEVEVLFAEHNYTLESWESGVREIPRLYLTNIPHRWRASTSHEITIRKKKELFFRALAPGVLRSNELVLDVRAGLIESRGSPDQASLDAMFEAYRIKNADFGELLRRVDSVPTSLVLAQAAEESGWGTSRFADVGNALFGQWTFGKGIAPLDRRTEKGEYSIAAFETPIDSVRAYLQNINSHPAYAQLREVRAQARAQGRVATGFELAKTLTSYSERGQEYVDSLHAIMRVNKLGPTDDAFLARKEAEAIYLVPVGEDSD